MSSLTQAVHTIQYIPPNINLHAYNSQAYTATAVAASRFSGDANLKSNALCVTYTPSNTVAGLCQQAYIQHTSGDNNCPYSKSFFVNASDKSVPEMA